MFFTLKTIATLASTIMLTAATAELTPDHLNHDLEIRQESACPSATTIYITEEPWWCIVPGAPRPTTWSVTSAPSSTPIDTTSTSRIFTFRDPPPASRPGRDDTISSSVPSSTSASPSDTSDTEIQADTPTDAPTTAPPDSAPSVSAIATTPPDNAAAGKIWSSALAALGVAIAIAHLLQG